MLVSPSFLVNATTTLTFWHTYAFQGTTGNCRDAGTLEISTNGGASWSVVPDAAFTAGGFNGTLVLMLRQMFRDFALEATAQSDQTRCVPRQELFVDARLVVEAFRVARRHELDQVVVALGIFGEQHQMVLCFPGIAALHMAAARRHVHLATENGIQAARARVVMEDHR